MLEIEGLPTTVPPDSIMHFWPDGSLLSPFLQTKRKPSEKRRGSISWNLLSVKTRCVNPKPVSRPIYASVIIGAVMSIACSWEVELTSIEIPTRIFKNVLIKNSKSKYHNNPLCQWKEQYQGILDCLCTYDSIPVEVEKHFRKKQPQGSSSYQSQLEEYA